MGRAQPGNTHLVEYLGAELIDRPVSDSAYAMRAPIVVEHYLPRRLAQSQLGESLSLVLGGKDGPELTYRLRMGLVHLLGDDHGIRSQIAQATGRLYNTRSKIVRTGVAEVPVSELGVFHTCGTVYVMIPFSAFRVRVDPYAS